ncbi:MAG: InlB B-repeat-containing protein, partial [Firmicutes bacterium]|nr:InlB B-repeat-containing protein [Bacillota bacterium]
LPPVNPIQEGYTFIGWYADIELSTPFSFTTMPAEDITLYAKWSINQYTISFEENYGSSVIDLTQDYGTEVNAPSIPIRQGYSFDNWFQDEGLITIYEFSTMPSADIVLYAKWNPNLYEVTFIYNNGQNNLVEINYAGTEMIEPSYLGYDFAGWYLDSSLNDLYASTTFPVSDMTLYAKWSLITYTILYELDGGENNPSNQNNYSILTSNFIYKDPIKEGYTFIGWFDNLTFEGSKITYRLQGTTGNKVLYAKWEVNQYSVNYYTYEYFDAAHSFLLKVNESIIKISSGAYHSALLTSEGRLFMWGSNNFGQLGVGTGFTQNTPKEITNQFTLNETELITDVFLGGHHSAALTSEGRLFMWGYNDYGQLGDNTTISKNNPIDITSRFNLNVDETIMSVYLGAEFSTAITSSNRIFAWGYNWTGQLGNGTMETKIVPTDITNQFNLSSGEKIESLGLGTAHSSAVTSSGRVFTWGYNWAGILGDGTIETRTTPVDITHQFNLEVGEKISSTSFGNSHSIALTSNGRLFVWGANSSNQLGDGTSSTRIIPIEITSRFNLAEGEVIENVRTFDFHTIVITSANRIFSWGSNTSGQLGDGTTINRNTPIEITSRFDLISEEAISLVSTGGYHSLAISSDGNIFKWGSNSSGQLGDNTYSNTSLPSKIASLNPILVNQDIYEFSSEVIPYTPIRDGFNFVGWFDNDFETQFIFTSMPSKNLTLVGYWQMIEYTITYHINGGNVVDENPSHYTVSDDDIVLVSPTKNGYSFMGWYDNPEFIGNNISIVSNGSFGDLQLYAKWQINQYTITFNSNFGNLIDPITQNYDTTVEAPINPIRQGYVFAGWYSNSILTNPYLFDKMTATNITLYAKWSPNVYVVTYILNNGEDNVLEVDYAGSELLHPIYLGYEFGGWFLDQDLTSPYLSSTFPTENQTLYAKWNLVYSITYTLDGGSNNGSNPISYTSNIENFELYEPSKKGYSFVNWYDNSDYFGEPISIIPQGSTGDIVLYAKWEVNQYKIDYYEFDNLDLSSEIPLSVGEDIEMLELGYMYSIALTSKGRVFTWGTNFYGELGDGTENFGYYPIEITENFHLYTNESIINIFAGNSISLAISSLGRVFIWGINFTGHFDGLVMTYFANAIPVDITSMFQLSLGEKIKDISTSGAKVLALSTSGRVFMWGESYEGIILDDRIIYEVISDPRDITSEFGLDENDEIIDISVGASFSLALSSNGQIFAWGNNDSGQLGNNTNENLYSPLNITSYFILNADEYITKIAAGGGHASAVTSSNRIFVWGNNYTGQLGNNSLINSNVPIDITLEFEFNTDEEVVYIDLGLDNSSLVTSYGRIYTWGDNGQGKLGDGTQIKKLKPVEITNSFLLNNDEQIVKLSLGGTHTSAITSKGRSLIWGYNGYGQLGDGTNSNSYYPKLTPFRSASILKSDLIDYNDQIISFEPEKEGFTFLGWYTDIEYTNLYVFDSMPASNLTLYGKWLINEYTIIYKDIDGTIFRVDLHKYNEPFDHVYEPDVQYKFFKEWSVDESLTVPLDFTNTPAYDLTLYAKWREINPPQVVITEIGSAYILFSFTWDNPDELQTLMLIPTISNSEYMAVSQDWVGFYDLQPNTEYTIYVDAGIGLYDSPNEDVVYVGSSIAVKTNP